MIPQTRAENGRFSQNRPLKFPIRVESKHKSLVGSLFTILLILGLPLLFAFAVISGGGAASDAFFLLLFIVVCWVGAFFVVRDGLVRDVRFVIFDKEAITIQWLFKQWEIETAVVQFIELKQNVRRTKQKRTIYYTLEIFLYLV
mgnify:CR=1 FL=1